MTTVTPNGNSYSDDGSAARDMRNGGHRTWLLPMLSDTLAEVANAESAATNAAGSEDAAAGSEANAAASAAAAAAAKSAAEAAAADLATVAYQDLTAISRKLVTAVGVAVARRDTSRDSDGGAWRKKCQQTSWYQEVGIFPALADIVVTASAVKIYDVTDPDAPEWYSFSTGSGYLLGSAGGFTSVAVRDGILVLGTSSGLYIVDFQKENVWFKSSASSTVCTSPFSNRNSAGNTYSADGGATIVNSAVNAVAITVLPFAPTDPVTGLPKPTIVAGTDGGASVIHPDGGVGSLTRTGGHQSVAFTPDGKLLVVRASGAVDRLRIPPAGTSTPDTNYRDAFYQNTTVPALWSSSLTTVKKVVPQGVAHGSGLTVLAENPVAPEKGMVAYVTKNAPPAWQAGSSVLCLSEKDTSSLVGGTVTDRSAKANNGTVFGTVTRTAVATGADLTAYGGFSAANYLGWAYDADFDFGDGDFCILMWFRVAPNAAIETLLERDSAVTAARFTINLSAVGVLQFATDDNADVVTATGPTVDDSVWRLGAFVMRGNRQEIWINGSLYASADASAVGSLNNGSAILRMGCDVAGSYPATHADITLPRLLAYAPSPEQMARIYADEWPLFQAGAKCLLGGTSNQVDALAYDPDTDRLLASGPDGTSIFKGLTRVAYIDSASDTNLTTDDHNAVAAARGGYLIGSAAEAVANLPALNLREELVR